VPGIHLCEPSPQRTPVLYQAGASDRGRQFGAENAEVIFIGAPTKEALREAVKDIRGRAEAAGRDPYDVKIINGHVVVTGADESAAKARYEDFRQYIDPEGALALWSGWLGTDLSRFDLDDPVAVTDNEFLKSSVQMYGQGQWTLRDFVDSKAIDAEGGFSVGSPTQVADDLQEWVEETDVDGFNLTNVITPGSFVDFVDYVVPELQRRGAYKTSYAEGTLRDKLFGHGPRLPETHRAANYRRVTEEANR
jgi:alkanesulfonate monooxygenase SsuD/methylene tetrahydromethanopterin reductase-like flavin-dependent oxidoreductase (luciferase family)